MAIGVRIISENLSGLTTNVTFYPDTGGMIDLGTQVFPFEYLTDYYFGTYNCYVPIYATMYPLIISGPPPTPTNTPTQTSTPTNTPSVTPTNTQTPSVTPTNTQTPSVTPTNTQTPSVTPTNTQTPSTTPTNTPTPSITASETPTPTVTPTITQTPSQTPSQTPTISLTPTNTVTPTNTPTVTPSNTPPNPTPTPTPTETQLPLGAYLFIEPTSGATAIGEWQTSQGVYFYGFTNMSQPSSAFQYFQDDIDAYVSFSGWSSGTFPTVIRATVPQTSGGDDSFGQPIYAYNFVTTQVNSSVCSGEAWYSWFIPTSLTNNGVQSQIGLSLAGPGETVAITMNSTIYANTYTSTGGTLPPATYRVYTTFPDPEFQITNVGNIYFRGNTIVP